MTDGSVALRKESVDRNVGLSALAPKQNTSLSARRAWIEITQRRDFKALGLPSLSARRAWIEIYWIADVYVTLPGRSPQGERG